MIRINGIRRADNAILRTGGSGDNWHMTWAKNDQQYVALCDGRGWSDMKGYTGKSYNTRVYAINGYPPNHMFQYLAGFPDLLSEQSPNVNRYYGFGILAVDDYIYLFLSTPNHTFDQLNPRFVGVKLVYSPDSGQSWLNQDGSPLRWEKWGERSRKNMVFFKESGEVFSLLTILQMGKSYEHNRDGYVYVYAPNGNIEGTMNELVMFRVRKDRILDRSAYEFYVSRNYDGSANWSTDINARGVVCTFPSSWVNTKIHPYSWHPSIVYNAQLGIYMMANWGMGTALNGMWFSKPSYLGFWTSQQPWGPWTQVHEENAWTPMGDVLARVYQPQIAPKWIAKDGKSFWLVFTDFQEIDGKRPYYCFNCQKVELLTHLEKENEKE